MREEVRAPTLTLLSLSGGRGPRDPKARSPSDPAPGSEASLYSMLEGSHAPTAKPGAGRAGRRQRDGESGPGRRGLGQQAHSGGARRTLPGRTSSLLQPSSSLLRRPSSTISGVRGVDHAPTAPRAGGKERLCRSPISSLQTHRRLRGGAGDNAATSDGAGGRGTGGQGALHGFW